jgi:hypothetical protein
MSIDPSEATAQRKRTERIARRERDRHEIGQRQESQDPDVNRREIRKRRLNWKNKFNGRPPSSG